jgi:hypothetical protein
VFSYKCPEHGDFRKRLDKRLPEVYCNICGKVSKPVIKAGSITLMERLDNGVMARAVERLHNVEEILDERSKKHAQEFSPENIGEETDD